MEYKKKPICTRPRIITLKRIIFGLNPRFLWNVKLVKMTTKIKLIKIVNSWNSCPKLNTKFDINPIDKIANPNPIIIILVILFLNPLMKKNIELTSKVIIKMPKNTTKIINKMSFSNSITPPWLLKIV
jgi:hypothetical protein